MSSLTANKEKQLEKSQIQCELWYSVNLSGSNRDIGRKFGKSFSLAVDPKLNTSKASSFRKTIKSLTVVNESNLMNDSNVWNNDRSNSFGMKNASPLRFYKQHMWSKAGKIMLHHSMEKYVWGHQLRKILQNIRGKAYYSIYLAKTQDSRLLVGKTLRSESITYVMINILFLIYWEVLYCSLLQT